MCRANWHVQSQRVGYFLRPTKLSWSRKENLREGTETPGVGLLANTIDGPERPTPLHLGPTKTRLPKTLRDHVRSASALSAFKKCLVANLSAKRQLSVAKLSAKRIFSLAKRDFLVANGRMAADFSSPESLNCLFGFLSFYWICTQSIISAVLATWQMSMIYFYIFFLSYGHTTLTIFCFFVCFLSFEGFPNKYLNLIEVISRKKSVSGVQGERYVVKKTVILLFYIPVGKQKINNKK